MRSSVVSPFLALTGCDKKKRLRSWIFSWSKSRLKSKNKHVDWPHLISKYSIRFMFLNWSFAESQFSKVNFPIFFLIFEQRFLHLIGRIDPWIGPWYKATIRKLSTWSSEKRVESWKSRLFEKFVGFTLMIIRSS